MNPDHNLTMNYTMISIGLTTEATLQEPSRVATAVGTFVMLVFLVSGFLGNLLILISLSTKQKMKNLINIFIISLIINDLLTYVLVVVFIIDSYMWHGWNAGDVLCKLNPELTLLFTGCSLWHTALIAIHRYIVVCQNSFYKRMSKVMYMVFVLFATRAIPSSCVFPGFSLNTSIYYPKMMRCILSPEQKNRMISVTLVQIIIPCIIVVVCYCFVFAFVRSISQHMHRKSMIFKREIQITLMFGVVFLMILLGFVPYAIVRNADSNNSFNADIYVFVTVVYAIATCSNPLVYGVMSTDIRRACLRMLKGLLHCLHIHRYCHGTNLHSMTVNDLTRKAENNICLTNYTEKTEKHTSLLRPDGKHCNGVIVERYDDDISDTDDSDQSRQETEKPHYVEPLESSDQDRNRVSGKCRHKGETREIETESKSETGACGSEKKCETRKCACTNKTAKMRKEILHKESCL